MTWLRSLTICVMLHSEMRRRITVPAGGQGQGSARALLYLQVLLAGFPLTLWDEPLCAPSEDVSLAAFHLDPPLLGKGGPVMHLRGSREQELRVQQRQSTEETPDSQLGITCSRGKSAV